MYKNSNNFEIISVAQTLYHTASTTWLPLTFAYQLTVVSRQR